VPLALMTMHAELEGVICSGPRRGSKPTYSLLARRAPLANGYSRDEALAELTRRYFRSHGPATVRDFSWWSGLTVADCRRGVEMAGARSRTVDGLTYWTVGARPVIPPVGAVLHLLPVYDEYLVAYRDLVAVPRGKAFWGVLPQAIVCGGQVIGTWKVVRRTVAPKIEIELARRLSAAERQQLDRAVARYSGFTGVPFEHQRARAGTRTAPVVRRSQPRVVR
jgi:hypothetical protein